jgi:TolB-like protein
VAERLPALGRRAAFWTTAAIASAAAVAGATLNLRHMGPFNGRTDRVVVARFANRTGDPSLNRLGELTADWITQGLSESDVVEVADPAMRLTRDDSAQQSDASAARALARATGSAVAVWGTFFQHADSLGFTAYLVDERHGNVVRSLGPVMGIREDPRVAIAALRQRIIANLAVILDPRLADWRGRTSQPPNYAAYREFTAGVDEMNRLNTTEAVRLLYHAAALDSAYTLPLVWAAFAHWWRFECDQTERLRRDLEVPGRMARADRLMWDRWVAQCHGDLSALYQSSRLLVETLPGSELMAGYLGRDALLFDRPREAVAVLTRLHPDRGALRDWPYYFYWLTAAYHSLGDHDRELTAARAARGAMPNSRNSVRQQAIALAALGRAREVSDLLDELPALPPHAWRTQAGIMREAGLELRAHGYAVEGDTVLGRTLAWLASRPVTEQATEPARRQRMQTLFAARMWEPAYALADSLAGELPDSLTYQGVLGALAAQRGDRRRAALADSVLALASRPFLQGYPAYWRACIAAYLGAPARAVRLLTQAHREGLWLTGEFWEQPIAALHADPCFESLHGDRSFQQLLRPKG